MGPFRRRSRGNSLSTIPPSIDTSDYSTENASLAASILYKSPLPSQNNLPVYILNSAAFPDSNELNYDALLPYVLARLPSDEQLIGGKGYEVVFLAGGEDRPSDAPKKARPGWSWFLQAYQILSRAMRKRLQKLYLVHERRWIRVMSETFSTIVSPKFRRKVVHVSSLSALALHIPIEDLLIPPSAYDRDRKHSPDIYVPFASGKRAFAASNPLPKGSDGNLRLPRVLRETSKFVLLPSNVSTEGLFRINSRAITTEVLKEAYDRGQKFILWKEPPSTVLAPTQFREGFGDVSIDEIEAIEGYSLTSAAGLIKMWYSSLREPLFPQASYAFIERVYGGPSPKPIEIPVFLDLIFQSADWSPLTRTARHILTMHLFPLLCRVAAHADENKMSPRNLATCFAPSTLCGPDPIQDMKMAAIVTRIIEYGIEHWDSDLAEKCGMGGTTFEEMLATPKNPVDREDPLDSGHEPSSAQKDIQQTGILLLDNDSTDTETETEPDLEHEDTTTEAPPPLPPRVSTEPREPFSPAQVSPNSTGSSSNDTGTVKRKPVPPLQHPPRYSTIPGPSAPGLGGLETSLEDMHVADGFQIDGPGLNRGRGSVATVSTLPLYAEHESGVLYEGDENFSRTDSVVDGGSFSKNRNTVLRRPVPEEPDAEARGEQQPIQIEQDVVQSPGAMSPANVGFPAGGGGGLARKPVGSGTDGHGNEPASPSGK